MLKNISGINRLRLLSGGVFVAATLALSGCGGGAPEADTAAAESQVIDDGQKIVMATHSFNVFVGPSLRGEGDGPLAALAAEAGKEGHETFAVQMIGGSTPMQHWNQGDGDDAANIAKAALLEHGEAVDVFTMSPNSIMPEEGVDLFGDFVIAHNPNARIMVQNSWSSYDGQGATPAVGGTGAGDFTNDDRDSVTLEDLDRWLNDDEPGLRGQGYKTRVREQLAGIDARAGREITYFVPSGPAVYELRKQVIQGNVPGVEKQSELFRDSIGHGAQPLMNLVTYVWFAAMYHESPVGLTALVDPEDETSAARERLLQQIAWNAVVSEPKSGVTGETVELGS